MFHVCQPNHETSGCGDLVRKSWNGAAATSNLAMNGGNALIIQFLVMRLIFAVGLMLQMCGLL